MAGYGVSAIEVRGISGDYKWKSLDELHQYQNKQGVLHGKQKKQTYQIN